MPRNADNGKFPCEQAHTGLHGAVNEVESVATITCSQWIPCVLPPPNKASPPPAAWRREDFQFSLVDSAGVPIVMVEHAAQEFLASDLTLSRCGDEFGVQDFIALALVRPARVIIAEPLA